MKPTYQFVMDNIEAYKKVGMDSVALSLEEALHLDFMRITRAGACGLREEDLGKFAMSLSGESHGIEFRAYEYDISVEIIKSLSASRRTELLDVFMTSDEQYGYVQLVRYVNEYEQSADRFRRVIASIRKALL